MSEEKVTLDSNLKTAVEVRVSYGEVDRMGFAYYGNYLRWFEISRAEYLRRRGKTYKQIEEGGMVLPVLEARVFYHHAAHYDDLLQVWAAPLSIAPVRLRYGYQILRREDGLLLATGYTEHTCLDDQRRICRFPLEFTKLLSLPPTS